MPLRKNMSEILGGMSVRTSLGGLRGAQILGVAALKLVTPNHCYGDYHSQPPRESGLAVKVLGINWSLPAMLRIDEVISISIMSLLCRPYPLLPMHE